ncbi:APO protein 3, mitochondrial [Labeo rohita]|uniref:APO protein 3, mitochondrial n=1 Tax=Labeo rohita TaxID=84645 RepID=A0ABQ8MUX4_LABRO|nr:APO protein 3, mitochondrial [Labeo rohita]
MNDPAVLILLLEQGDCSLEDHTEDFVFLANYTHYPDNCLYSFYFAGLNTTTQAQLSGDDDTSPPPDPVPRPPSPCSTERQPEPTPDGELKPSATDEPWLSGATELRIAPEPEPIMSNQVREPATSFTTEEFSVEHEDAEEGPAHYTTAGGEQTLDSGDVIDFVCLTPHSARSPQPLCSPSAHH